MERNISVFLLGALWEIFRLFVLFLVLSAEHGLNMNILGNMFLLWYGAAQLVLSAGYILLGLYPDKYGSLARLLALGKFLGLVPGIGVIIIQASVLFFVQTDFQISGFSFIILPGIIVFIDLIFFVFLLSYSKSKKKYTSQSDEKPSLPELNETRIEED